MTNAGKSLMLNRTSSCQRRALQRTSANQGIVSSVTPCRHVALSMYEECGQVLSEQQGLYTAATFDGGSSAHSKLRFCIRVRPTPCLAATPKLTAVSIDGVLVRSSDALPRAHKALSYLQSERIPFILLTNGGGRHETDRVAELSKKLQVPIDTSMFVQSHTPFADMDHLKDKTVLVVGGEADKCRTVAEAYG